MAHIPSRVAPTSEPTEDPYAIFEQVKQELTEPDITPARLEALLTWQFPGPRPAGTSGVPPTLEEIWVRSRACAHPHLPRSAMTRVAKNFPAQLRAALATNPALFPSLQRYIAEHDKAITVLTSLAKNPGAAPTVVELLAHYPDPRIRRHIAVRNPLAGFVQKQLSQDPDQEVRVNLAVNHSTIPAVLQTLTRDPDPSVRLTATTNPHTAASTLVSLASDPDHNIQLAVAEHAHTPVPTLRHLYKHDPSLWNGLAKNPILPEDLLVALSYSQDKYIYGYLLSHPHLPEPDQLRLAIYLQPRYGSPDPIGLPFGRRPASARVDAWRAALSDNDQLKEILIQANLTTRSIGAGLLKSRAGIQPAWEDSPSLRASQALARQIKELILFPPGQPADPEIWQTYNLEPEQTYAWWEPSFGPSWICVAAARSTVPYPCLVNTPVESMPETQFWFTYDPQDHQRIHLWTHSDTKIETTPDGLQATTSVTYPTPLKDLPPLPRFEASYAPAGPPTQLRGLLLLGPTLLALWLDPAGHECGWEQVTDPAAALTPHSIELLASAPGDSVAFPAHQWNRFEAALRTAAIGRTI